MLSSVDEQSETVYQLSPSFRLAQSSARLNASVDYRLDAYYYDKQSDSNIFHNLDAQATTALDRDNLFLDVGASRSQVIRDPSEPVPFGNLPISSNRTDRDEYYLGPSFQYPLAANITASGSYRRAWIRYDETAPGFGLFSVRDFEQDSTQIGLDNYRRQRGVTWAVRYNAQETDYGLFDPWKYRQASVELGAWAGGGFRVFATGGKESAWDDPFDAGLEDEFWEAGFAKQGGDRFSAEFAAGERTFGSSRRASLNWAFRRGQTSLNYVEQPTTQGRDPLGALFPGGPNDFLDRPGAIERYITNRLQWSVGFELRRSSFTVRLFDEEREQRFRLDGLPLPDEEQTGVSVSASWQAGARTNLSFTAQRAEREFVLDNVRTYASASFRIDYGLGAKTDLSFVFSRATEESDEGAFGGDYDSNFMSLLLTRRFWTPR